MALSPAFTSTVSATKATLSPAFTSTVATINAALSPTFTSEVVYTPYTYVNVVTHGQVITLV